MIHSDLNNNNNETSHFHKKLAMEDKVEKLRVATQEAEENLKVCRETWKVAEEQFAAAKDVLKTSLSPEKQEKTMMNDTHLPELLETQIRAKNLYETALARCETNCKYLAAFEAKLAKK